MSVASLQIVGGVVVAAALVIFLRRTGRNEVFAYSIGLGVAALIYVAFGLITGREVMLQIVGLVVFGALAGLGFRTSAKVVGVGWLLHAGWDGWHLMATHPNPAPDWYSNLCIGFDVLIGLHMLFPPRPRKLAAAVILIATSIGGGAAVPARAQQSHGPDSRPNILFIFTDDHAFQAISAYGGRLAEVAPTPNLDRIADQGMRFDHAYVTNSICAPSRAVIQTGKYSHINGVTDNREVFDASQQTFPKLLQAAGYETAFIGKWHLKAVPQGFDYADRLPGQGKYYNPDFIQDGDTVRFEGYATDIITDKALAWLGDRAGKDTRPFLLMLQHKAPHREWSPPIRYLNLFDDVHIPEPGNLFDDYDGRGTAAHMQEMEIANDMFYDLDLKLHDWPDTTRWFKGWRERLTPKQLSAWDAAYSEKNKAFYDAQLKGDDLTRWKYQRYMQDYLATIRAVDENVGRVLDYLDESGLADNTIVIYTSDQGFYLGEHGWFDKRWMYEESFRTPLLIKWPGVTKPGSVNGDLVANLDFAETMLAMAGVDVPADMQGASLVPLLQEKTPDGWREYLYYHYYEYPGWHSVRKHEGVFDGRYKLISFYNIGEWELYDLETDPHEMRSVYGEPEYAEIQAKLTAELAKLREVYKLPPNESSHQ